MQVIAVDIMVKAITRIPIYLFVVGDYFTCWMAAFTIYDQEATTVAQKLVEEVCCCLGISEQSHFDQEKPQSKLIDELCKILKIYIKQGRLLTIQTLLNAKICLLPVLLC